MFNKKVENAIFSFERKAVPTLASQDKQPYFPFAEAWKEFDTLQKAVRGGSRLSIVRHVAELLIFLAGVGIIEFHPSKRVEQMFALGFIAVLAAEFLQWLVMKRRFQHWPCPHCNSEWPGDKNEKERACGVCGLRLHQLAP